MEYANKAQVYANNDGMQPYEDELGHLELSRIANLTSFLRWSDSRFPAQGPCPSQEQVDAKDAESEKMLRGPGGDPLTPNPSPPGGARGVKRCTAKEAKRRRDAIRQMLVDGFSTDRIVDACKTMFKIGRRQTQLYIRQVKDAMAEAAAKEDYLAHLQASKLRNERLLQMTMRRLESTEKDGDFARLSRQTMLYSKEIDRIMEQIKEHRELTNRDQSPDSEAAKAKRDDFVVMPRDELFERLEHMRNRWFVQFNSAFMWGAREAQRAKRGEPGKVADEIDILPEEQRAGARAARAAMWEKARANGHTFGPFAPVCPYAYAPGHNPNCPTCSVLNATEPEVEEDPFEGDAEAKALFEADA